MINMHFFRRRKSNSLYNLLSFSYYYFYINFNDQYTFISGHSKGYKLFNI